jgi:hypothetical protein
MKLLQEKIKKIFWPEKNSIIFKGNAISIERAP